MGREPFALLGHLSAITDRLVLGTSIASIWARDAMAARAGALTLAEASGNRFVLGLGVSHAHLTQNVRGHTYERPLTRMREYLGAYRAALWKGPLTDEPPVIVAALRERMLELAATEADGAFPYLVTAERVAWMRGRLDSASASGTRPLLCVTLPVVLERDQDLARATARRYLASYLRTPNYQGSWEAQGFGAEDWEKPGSDRLVDGMVAWGEADSLRERVAGLHAAGADHVALIPLSPEGTTEEKRVIDALAPR